MPAALALTAFAALAARSGIGGSHRRVDEGRSPGPAELRQPATSTSPTAAPTTAAAAPTTAGSASTATGPAFASQRERRFITVGTLTRQQFTDEQFRILADHFGVVQLTKFHAGFDIRRHHEAARRLVSLQPGIEVYPYFSTKYWFDNNRWDGAEIDPSWLLRDSDGRLIERDRTRDGEVITVSSYVDLANPAYRSWALNVLATWLAAAPYAGVYFDAASPLGEHDEGDIAKWEGLLGRQRLDQYNAGLRELLSAAETMVGPRRQVVFNGIAPNPLRGPGRNLDLLALTDGALDERFCVSVQGGIHFVEEDLALLVDRRDKHLFMRTNYKSSFDQSQRDRHLRLCLGLFLLGWEPGRSYFQFGADYTDAQLEALNPDLDVNLGRPAGAHRSEGDLRTRDFESGSVFVNLGRQPAVVSLASAVTVVRDGKVGASHPAGARLTVPPGDAVFVLRSSFLSPSSHTRP